MNFNEYQTAALETATYPKRGNNLIYPAMGLAGEAGETTDKVKKYWRNLGVSEILSADDLKPEQVTELIKEIGDVLWYAAALSSELGFPLEIVAERNIEKLQDRVKRGVIKSEGDNR